MSTAIIHKKTAISGRLPTTSQLELGEIAINTYDGTLHIKKDDGTASIVTLGQIASIDDIGDVDTSTTSPSTGQALAWNGASWVPQTISGSGNTTYSEQTIVSDPYTGNGTQVDFSTSIVPQSEDSVMVMLNGVVQDPQTYSLLGDVVTFSTAPANGDNVELRTFSGFSTSVQLSNYYSYVYTLSSDATSVSGSDDNSQTLAYQVGKVEVYVNGVRLVDGDDYTATNTTSISFNETVFAGSVVEVVSLASAALLNEALQIQSSSQVLTTTTANQAVEVFDAATYGTAKFIVQMKHATAGIQSSEVLVTHDGSNAYFTVYGEIYSTAVLGTISADVNSGNVRLLVTPVNTNTTVKTKRISVEA